MTARAVWSKRSQTAVAQELDPCHGLSGSECPIWRNRTLDTITGLLLRWWKPTKAIRMKRERRTYFTIAPKSGSATGAFSQLDLPQGNTARVLSESVFRKAINAANKRLATVAPNRSKAAS